MRRFTPHKWLEEPYVLREGHCTAVCAPCTYSEDPEQLLLTRGAPPARASNLLLSGGGGYLPAQQPSEALDALPELPERPVAGRSTPLPMRIAIDFPEHPQLPGSRRLRGPC